MSLSKDVEAGNVGPSVVSSGMAQGVLSHEMLPNLTNSPPGKTILVLLVLLLSPHVEALAAMGPPIWLQDVTELGPAL